jgi:hypothetical protein
MNNIYFMLITLAYALSGSLCVEARELSFPDNFTWKGIFDQGFRPKQLSGLEHSKAVIYDQGLILKYKDEQGFVIGRGRLTISLLPDDRIRFLSLTQKEAISLEDAQKKLDLFHEIFGDSLKSKGTVPKVIEERSQTLDMLSAKNAWAISNGHNVKFGFERSYGKRGWVMPSLLIGRRGLGDEPMIQRIRRHDITPPEGYEDYDISPKGTSPKREDVNRENTAKVDEKPDLKATNPIKEKLGPDSKKQTQSAEEDASQSSSSWFWFVVGACVIGVLIVLVKLWRNTRK